MEERECNERERVLSHRSLTHHFTYMEERECEKRECTIPFSRASSWRKSGQHTLSMSGPMGSDVAGFGSVGGERNEQNSSTSE